MGVIEMISQPQAAFISACTQSKVDHELETGAGPVHCGDS